MKKIICVFLATVFSLSVTTSAFAKTLEYNDIENEVLTNNLQVKNNNATIKNLKLNRVVLNNSMEMEDATESLVKGLDKTMENGMVSPDVAVTAQGTKMSLAMVSELYSSMAAQQGTISGYNQQLNLTKIKLEHVDRQLVNAAKSLFVSYHQLQSNLESLNANKESALLALNAVKVRNSLGLATTLEVSEQEKNYQTLLNNISDLENQINVIKGEINKMTGGSFKDELTVGNLPEPDMAYLDKINVENDFITAKNNSYDLKYLNKEYDYLKKSSDSTVAVNNRMMKRNEIKSEEEALLTSLTQKYNDILKQKSNLESENKKLTDEKQKYANVEKKYSLGTASGMEIKLQKNALKSQEAVVKIAKYSLFLEIENYKAILNGISV